MTYKDLRDAVCQLGFEIDVERPELFFTAACAAQRMLFDDLPTVTELRRHLIYTPPSSLADMPVLPDTPLVLPRPRGGLTLVSTGRGTLALTDGVRTTLHPLAEGTELSLLLSEGGSVRVSADEPLVLRRLAVYANYTGPLPSPRGERRIDLLDGTGTPLLPIAVPTVDASPIPEARFEDGYLILPASVAGEVSVRCRRTPRIPETPADADTVDLPTATEHLLALLTASLLWLDAEPERAQYHRALYREGVARRVGASMHSRTEPYNDVLGW